MTIASDRLQAIREQVQFHLDQATPEPLSAERQRELTDQIKQNLEKHNAVIVAHYYTAPEIQALAEETGGCVSDSLEMARFGHDHDAQTLIVAVPGPCEPTSIWQTGSWGQGGTGGGLSVPLGRYSSA